MRKNVIWIFALLLLSLVFQGESCITDERSVSSVLTLTLPVDADSMWHTTGFTDTFDDTTFDVGQEIKDAIDDGGIDIDSIAAIEIAGGCYEVIASTGHDAQRTGTVKVNMPGDPQLEALAFDVPNNQPGTEGKVGDGSLSFKSPGITYLNNALNDFLDDLQNGQDPGLVLHFRSDWTSTPPPTQGDPDDFYWKTCIVIQITYVVDVTVPNPGGE